jgi:hypothetical protein
MKKLLFLLPILVMTVGCNAQHKQNEKQENQTTETRQDNKPQVSWKVNKKYDDKGNLIGYDSTYTWTYSSKGGKVHNVQADSVMAAFRKQFNAQFPSIFSRHFGDPIWSDSLFYRDFTTPDYFMKKWNEHYFNMHGMMEQMDSMRNSFLQKNYPGLSTEKKQL